MSSSVEIRNTLFPIDIMLKGTGSDLDSLDAVEVCFISCTINGVMRISQGGQGDVFIVKMN